MHSPRRAQVLTRLAVPADRTRIVAFCRGTWGPGHEDYIEHVIDRWITGDDGRLAVAEHDGRPVACCYVRFMSPCEAFLAGMRVDPTRRRSGLALALTDYCVAYAAEQGRTVTRLIVGWNNLAALGAVGRAGFTQAGSMTHWDRAAEGPPGAVEVVAPASDAAERAPGGTLWAVGWSVRELTAADFEERARSGWAIAHNGGIALLRPGEDHLWLAWLDGSAAARARLVRAAVQVTARASFPRCRALLANDPATENALAAAGFARGLEYHVFEKRTS